MKNSPRVNVKVAVLPQKDEVVQRLRNFVLIAFAIVATVFLVEIQMAAILGLVF
jgi:hypothetical protein